MKTRMIWRYMINTREGWWGTCPKWAAESAISGHQVLRERVMWVGKVPTCWSCEGGFH